MHQRFHGLASMATTCRAFSTKHDHKPEAYATSGQMANACRHFVTESVQLQNSRVGYDLRKPKPCNFLLRKKSPEVKGCQNI